MTVKGPRQLKAEDDASLQEVQEAIDASEAAEPVIESIPDIELDEEEAPLAAVEVEPKATIGDGTLAEDAHPAVTPLDDDDDDDDE